MTTFKDFLKEGQPFGDTVDLPFVNDAVTDPHLPDPKSWDELESYIKGRPKSWEELESYIKGRNPDALDNTLKAASHVWWELYEPYRKEGLGHA